MNVPAARPYPRRLIAMAGAGAFVATLYLAREILIPLALATFFCFLLTPVAQFIERRMRIGRVLSVLLVVTGSFSVIGSFGWLIGTQAAGLIESFPEYQHTIISKIERIRDTARSVVGRATATMERLTDGEKVDREPGEVRVTEPGSVERAVDGASERNLLEKEIQEAKEEPVKVELVSPGPDLLGIATQFLGPVVHPLATVGVTFVLILFFLINRDDLRDRIIRICGNAQIPLTTAALSDCARRVMRFLAAQVIANCCIGIAIGAGLYFLGVPNAVLWGLIAAVARFLPYIGTFIATMLPFMLSVAVFDGWEVPVLVVSWCILVDLLSANVLEPWLYGVRTGVSATAIVLAFMFWTWIWGGFGLFLATPITVCLVALGKYIPSLESVYILLSDEPVLLPGTRFYQRLLARDEVGAVKVAMDFAAQEGPVDAVDRVILPGLARVASDLQANLIGSDTREFALKVARSVIESPDFFKLPEHGVEAAATTTARPPLVVVTNAGPFDEIAAEALQLAFRARGGEVQLTPNDGLTSEVVDAIMALRPTSMAMLAVEPRTLGRLRLIFKRLRAEQQSLSGYVLVVSYSAQTRRNAARFAAECGTGEFRALKDLIERPVSGSAMREGEPASEAPLPGILAGKGV